MESLEKSVNNYFVHTLVVCCHRVFSKLGDLWNSSLIVSRRSLRYAAALGHKGFVVEKSESHRQQYFLRLLAQLVDDLKLAWELAARLLRRISPSGQWIVDGWLIGYLVDWLAVFLEVLWWVVFMWYIGFLRYWSTSCCMWCLLHFFYSSMVIFCSNNFKTLNYETYKKL